jgi:membrane protease subunit HflK
MVNELKRPSGCLNQIGYLKLHFYQSQTQNPVEAGSGLTMGENLRDCLLHVSPNNGEAKSEDTIRMSPQTGNGNWGGSSGRGTNPGHELEQLIEQGQERLKKVMLNGGSGKFITLAVLAALLVGAWTAYYTVPSDSVAVVQRFGKYVKDVQPGLHFKLPMGIDTATIVPVKRQLKQEFGFTTPGAADPFQSPVDGRRETDMVTGDLNAALVEWVVQYRISDPVKFLFEVREPGATLRYVSESVMREVVGDRTVDEVITIGRQEIESEALTKMQALSTKYAMGISIDQVQLKNINPPGPVQESFNEVNQAQQEKEKLINEARRDYNKVIPLAEGEKDQRIREADGYRLKRINEAEGDVARFSALLTEYTKAPEVTRRRIYVETLQAVLPGIRSKIIVDDQTHSILPLMNLDAANGEQP